MELENLSWTASKASMLRTARRIDAAAKEFLLKEASAWPLAVLRIGVSATLFLTMFSIRNDFLDIYGSQGYLQEPLKSIVNDFPFASIDVLRAALEPFGIPEPTYLGTIFVLYLGSMFCLMIGLFTRLNAVIAWACHWLLKSSGQAALYGVDQFASIFLFYFAIMPVSAEASIDKLLGRAPPSPSWLARLSLRVIQIHLCIVYFASGVSKLLGPQWWYGESIWRSLMLPMYARVDISALAPYTWFFLFGAWGTMVIEIGYPVFIWPRKTRKLWIFAVLALHVGIAIFLRLESFGLLMLILTLGAFAVSAEPSLSRAKLPVGRNLRIFQLLRRESPSGNR